jgi:hypothetical protein
VYNVQTMTQPTADQSKGYDIVIWAEEGSIVAKSYTILGEVAFHGLLPEHRMGQKVIMDELVQPDEFFKQMPPGIRIGAMNPESGKIHLQIGLASLQ